MRKPTAESNPFLIRAARADEAEAIVALIQRAFGEYRGKLRPESGALLETADTIRTAMTTATVLVAERAGRILGCVSVRRKDGHGYAGRLAVEPMERRIGVARALMAQAEGLARQMGADRLQVDVRLKLRDNRAFFRALGFKEGAERCHPGFSQSTYVEMEKILI
ncbi:MAG: GNAT family N-acetyltransferase [Rhodospirillaceae bacterium]|nr:GNAT family N-acetyltransferase [Rhodospirillaceae bacterium]